jgi:hypothetical protein
MSDGSKRAMVAMKLGFIKVLMAVANIHERVDQYV